MIGSMGSDEVNVEAAKCIVKVKQRKLLLAIWFCIIIIILRFTVLQNSEERKVSVVLMVC